MLEWTTIERLRVYLWSIGELHKIQIMCQLTALRNMLYA